MGVVLTRVRKNNGTNYQQWSMDDMDQSAPNLDDEKRVR